MGTPVDKDVTLRNAAKHVKWGQGMGNIDWQVSGEERSRENLVLVLVNTETVLEYGNSFGRLRGGGK